MKKVKYQIRNWQWGILGIYLTTASMTLQAQTDWKSYYFEEDKIVFEFDLRKYREVARQDSLELLDFSDFDIEEVVVSGNFNEWSEKAWKMKQVGPYTYQLRKNIEEINDMFIWHFKFLVNGQYWVDPDSHRLLGKVIADDIWEDVYEMDLYDVNPVEQGNAHFRLAAYPKAKEVILAGSFNGWNEEHLKMTRVGDAWEMNLQLAIGRYEYKFIVDGEWIHDPTNSEKVRNEFHTYNSVLEVKKLIVFELDGYQQAEEIVLAGSFNNWDKKQTRMERQEWGWRLELPLTSGKHFYKFLVDGQWVIDPQNPLSEYDKRGNLNSIVLIQ